MDEADPMMARRNRSRPAMALVVAGALAVVGSLLTWDTCPDTACGRDELAFFILVDMSGVDWGIGFVTVALGIVLVAAGVSGRDRPTRAVARIAGVAGWLVVLTCVAFVLRMHVFTDTRFYGPGIGVFVVLFAGVVAILAARTVTRSLGRRHPA